MENEKHALITLFRGELAIVDNEDFLRLSKYSWHAYKYNGNTYAARSVYDKKLKTTRKVRMHNEVTGFKFCDHKNGNGLDNRKENLRESNKSSNMMNKKRYKNAKSKFKRRT